MTRPFSQSAIRFPLSVIFATEANTRILRELSSHGGQLASTDIARRAKLTLSATNATLVKLAKTGLIEPTGSGRSKLYNLNRGTPLYESIKALFKAEEARFAAITEAIRACALTQEDTVLAVWIYGSVARGEDNLCSDLDIAFIARDSDVLSVQTMSVDILSAAGQKLTFFPSVNTLSLTDIKRLRDSNDSLWQAFLKDCFVIYGPRPESIKGS
jgi:predicted nucleotidyltransferase